VRALSPASQGGARDVFGTLMRLRYNAEHFPGI
jgi:hypothetical protein